MLVLIKCEFPLFPWFEVKFKRTKYKCQLSDKRDPFSKNKFDPIRIIHKTARNLSNLFNFWLDLLKKLKSSISNVHVISDGSYEFFIEENKWLLLEIIYNIVLLRWYINLSVELWRYHLNKWDSIRFYCIWRSSTVLKCSWCCLIFEFYQNTWISAKMMFWQKVLIKDIVTFVCPGHFNFFESNKICC